MIFKKVSEKFSRHLRHTLWTCGMFSRPRDIFLELQNSTTILLENLWTENETFSFFTKTLIFKHVVVMHGPN